MTTPIRRRRAWPLVNCCIVLAMCSQSCADGSHPSESSPSKSNSAASTVRHPDSGQMLRLYPHAYEKHPRIRSPWTSENGTEIIIGHTKDGKFTLVPVTVEDGPPVDWRTRRFTKGKQLEVDRQDFPALATSGLHDDKQLLRLTTITGRPLEEITRQGRPGGLSGDGFLAADEDIISVLKGDNALVRKLGLTHPQTARPLFHVLNVILLQLSEGARKGRLPRFWDQVSPIEYRGRTVHLKGEGSRGYQESLFNDEILGNGGIDLWCDLLPEESRFLDEKYPHLSEEQRKELVNRLTRIHTAEMQPYYVKRYGFYEGHTGWRVDPVAIAFVFGLKSLEEIEQAFPGQLYDTLTGHFTAKH